MNLPIYLSDLLNSGNSETHYSLFKPLLAQTPQKLMEGSVEHVQQLIEGLEILIKIPQ